LLKTGPARVITISYSYSSMVPLSEPRTLNPFEPSRGRRTFLTAF